MGILLSNLLSKSIFDFEFLKADLKRECPYFYSNFFFEEFRSVLKKSQKMDFPLYFQKVMLLWQRSLLEIDYGSFRVFGPYFIGKSLGTL